jgi:2-polyprenyl-3-methyl-5-hydroxy-6-metoxy-1,4-benzoquinol methylase
MYVQLFYMPVQTLRTDFFLKPGQQIDKIGLVLHHVVCMELITHMETPPILHDCADIPSDGMSLLRIVTALSPATNDI